MPPVPSATTCRGCVFYLHIIMRFYRVILQSRPIVNYISFIIQEHGVGREKCHQVAQACSFYFKYVYPSAFIVPSAFYPRRSHKLPQVFSVALIQQLLALITNQKQLMMVSLFYGTGLLMNGLRNIKLTDIDSKSYQIKVVAGTQWKKQPHSSHSPAIAPAQTNG